MPNLIYKIATKAQWAAAEEMGVFKGAPIDLQDGYIHFSTAQQTRETLQKHFAGQNDLLLVSVDADRLGEALKYEVSRNDALFPHLYADLSLKAVTNVQEISLNADGSHHVPQEMFLGS